MDNNPFLLSMFILLFFASTILMALYQMFKKNIVLLSLLIIFLQLFSMWHMFANAFGRPFGVTEWEVFWSDFSQLKPYTFFVIISYNLTFYWWYSIWRKTKKTA